jgi:O-antigen/teichoic acid export membrane protein
MEKMEWEAGIFLFTNLAIVTAGFILLAYSPTPKAFGWAYAIGTGLGAITATFTLRNYLKRIFSYFSSRLVLPIIRSAWPFAVTGALGILLTNTDILIISWIRTASEVGIYAAAIRIIQILYVIPGVLQFSILPLFARLANKDNEKFRAALERTVSLVSLASIPIALGGAILGTQIMSLVFGAAYEPGGLAFKILMFTMIVDYPIIMISAAIFSYNHQKSLIAAAVIGSVSNVVLDLLFIPPFGIAGSAVATLLAQIASNWYLWRTMKKINYFDVFPKLKKVIASGAIMAAVTAIFFALGVNVVVNIFICAAIYFLLLAAFREPLLREIKETVFGAQGTPALPNG